MKPWILMISAGLVLAFLAWRLAVKPNQNAPSSSAASLGDLEDFKALFFADQTLEEITKKADASSPASAEPPWSLFASALADSRQGKVEEAKKDLKKVLALPDGESRVRLWAWRALRELGERPPASLAGEVHGVVCELHNEAGVGTIAAYSDGRARWLGGQGKITVWEAPGSDAEIGTLIKNLLKSAEPLVETAPASDRHTLTEPKLDYFRVSVLTYGGIHVAEVFGPEIEEGHLIAPVLMGSLNLLEALSKRSDEQDRKAGSR